MLRIVIIEDEPATARNLHFTLQETDEPITLITMLDSVKTAVDWLNNNQEAYDLLFMDIQLSDGLSFSIFDQIKINSPVIFVTAFDDYALQAFKTNGIDYILKPFDKTELQRALNKFKSINKNNSDNNQSLNLIDIIEKIKSGQANYKQSFLVHFRDKLIPIAAKEIAWFYTVNEVSFAIGFDKRKFIVEFTLEQLQQQLDPHIFFRANRQYIVQRNSVTEVAFYFNGRLVLKTEPAADENILISKARVPEFKDWMNK